MGHVGARLTYLVQRLLGVVPVDPEVRSPTTQSKLTAVTRAQGGVTLGQGARRAPGQIFGIDPKTPQPLQPDFSHFQSVQRFAASFNQSKKLP
jgi:hypothetical protein